jgi:MSHA biogenesis protein MshJ
VTAFNAMLGRLGPVRERFDALAVRERGLIFSAAVVVIYFTWQSLLMDPLLARGRQAAQRLAEVRVHMQALDQVGVADAADPLIAAATRNRSLQGRLAELERELQTVAQGYVAPERVTQMLRELLTRQQGLALVSLENLPVESLSQTLDAARGETIAADDRGPFLHPVEIVVDGDYASVTAYLRSLEQLPWRIYWQRLELTAGSYPLNRVYIVIGALSLSRDWIRV